MYVRGFGLDVLLYNHEGACPSDCMKVHPDEEESKTSNVLTYFLDNGFVPRSRGFRF